MDYGKTPSNAETKRSIRFQWRIAVLAGAGMFIDGYDVSVIAVALPGLKEEWGIGNGLLSGVIASSVVVGMFFGMLYGGRLVDRFGRRKMYMYDLIGFVIFALVAALAFNPPVLIFARFALGLFIGADYPISSSMTAEFTSPRRRGSYIIFMSLLWQLGSFSAYILGLVFLPIGDNAWRWMLGAGAILAVIVIILRHNVPESPRWLRSQGRFSEAMRIEKQVKDEYDITIGHKEENEPGTNRQRWVELFSPKMLRATVFCSVYWFAFAVSFYGIQMYTPTILEPFAGGRHDLPFLGAALIAFLGVLGAALGMYAVEAFGRRKLIISCFCVMVAALVTLALWSTPGLLVLVLLLSVTILMANMGPGVLNMVYPNEMFPTRLRGSGVGFAGSVSRIGSILGVLLFPVLVGTWGMQNATWLFVGVALVGTVVSITLAPETKGRSLDELENLADHGWRDKEGKMVFYGEYDSGERK
ncbi:MFS transporter [Gleimia hominis]|uniref:MFS transporter n=1 Tax=Gleimia hominis TaxID=595468 RepID=UPI000C806A27|nr:MFS transporter [Gleimia hominis]WIK64393.1 MFS transporter [Gleimia hominis]